MMLLDESASALPPRQLHPPEALHSQLVDGAVAGRRVQPPHQGALPAAAVHLLERKDEPQLRRIGAATAAAVARRTKV